MDEATADALRRMIKLYGDRRAFAVATAGDRTKVDADAVEANRRADAAWAAIDYALGSRTLAIDPVDAEDTTHPGEVPDEVHH